GLREFYGGAEGGRDVAVVAFGASLPRTGGVRLPGRRDLEDGLMSHELAPICVWLEAFARAVRDRDYDAGRRMFAPDVVSFGTVAGRVECLVDQCATVMLMNFGPR